MEMQRFLRQQKEQVYATWSSYQIVTQNGTLTDGMMYEILEGWRNIYFFASPGYEKDAYRAVVGYPAGNIWTPGGKASYNYEARPALYNRRIIMN